MKKRILRRLGILAVIAAAGFVLLVWWTGPTNLVNIEDFGRVQGGMTEEEVVEVLGIRGARVQNFRKQHRINLEGIDFGGGPSSVQQVWRTRDGKTIWVGFDASGRVTMTAKFTVEESWLDKVRRWLRFS